MKIALANRVRDRTAASSAKVLAGTAIEHVLQHHGSRSAEPSLARIEGAHLSRRREAGAHGRCSSAMGDAGTPLQGTLQRPSSAISDYLELSADDLDQAFVTGVLPTCAEEKMAAWDVLGDTELAVVYLALADRTADAPVAGRLGRSITALCGFPVGNRLASARLEALRRFALAARRTDRPSDKPDRAELRAFGFPEPAIAQVLAIAARDMASGNDGAALGIVALAIAGMSCWCGVILWLIL